MFWIGRALWIRCFEEEHCRRYENIDTLDCMERELLELDGMLHGCQQED